MGFSSTKNVYAKISSFFFLWVQYTSVCVCVCPTFLTKRLIIHWILQEKFCNNACVERFLRVKGDNVKKTVKQLRNCLAWRESLGTGNLTV